MPTEIVTVSLPYNSFIMSAHFDGLPDTDAMIVAIRDKYKHLPPEWLTEISEKIRKGVGNVDYEKVYPSSLEPK